MNGYPGGPNIRLNRKAVRDAAARALELGEVVRFEWPHGLNVGQIVSIISTAAKGYPYNISYTRTGDWWEVRRGTLHGTPQHEVPLPGKPALEDDILTYRLNEQAKARFREMRRLQVGGMSVRDLSKHYGISKQRVYQILRTHTKKLHEFDVELSHDLTLIERLVHHMLLTRKLKLNMEEMQRLNLL